MPLKLARRHGSPFWYIRGSVRGQAVDESTGLADRDAAEAVRAKREWELQQEAVFGRRATATFLKAAVSYMEEGGERRFVGPLLKHFGTTKLTAIGQDEIDEAGKRLYPGRSPSTVNRQVHTVMRAIIAHAAAKGWADDRPVKRPRQPKGNTRWLTPAEAEALIAACSPHMRAIVVFLLYTGARVREALTLDWRDVDLARAHVQLIDTKSATGGKNRGVPLHPRVVAELANLPGEVRAGRVFRTHKGRPYVVEKGDDGGGQLKTGFRAALRRGGVSHCRPHDLRHTWATWHYAKNRDLKVLMQLGGWDDEASVQRYTHVNVDHLAPSIAALPGG